MKGVLNFRWVWLVAIITILALEVGYGQTYPGIQQSSLINLYKQADTRGVLVIGSGAPVFVPKARQSRVYIDSVAGQLYVRRGGAWHSVGGTHFGNTDLEQTGNRHYNGKGFDYSMDSIRQFDIFSLGGTRLGSMDIVLDGNKSLTLGSQKLAIDIPSRGAATGGSFLTLSGDSLLYSTWGFRNHTPTAGYVLVSDGTNYNGAAPAIIDNQTLSFAFPDSLKITDGGFVAINGSIILSGATINIGGVLQSVGTKLDNIDAALNSQILFLSPAAAMYDNDAAAAIGGVGVGSWYVLSATNTYSLPEGMAKRRVL
jgi:hypothetical protein